MSVRRLLIAVPLAGALALGAAACGSSKKSTSTNAPTQTITLGKADFPESQLLAEIYGQALENGNIRVARKDPIGSRELYYQAIVNNEIQLIPEYTNSLLTYVLSKKNPPATSDAKTIDDQVKALKADLPQTLTIGKPSAAEDKDVIVCTKAVADQYKLTNLSELAAAAGNIKIGGPPEFETRTPFGIKGFKDELGATFKSFTPLKIGQIADSLKSGAIDCGNLFSTMSAITTEGFVALDDDKTLVPHEAVLPLLTTAAATPDVVQILDSISAQLNTDVLKAMMVKIEVDKQSPEVVAKSFLAGDFQSSTTPTSTGGAGSTPATGASTAESAPPTT